VLLAVGAGLDAGRVSTGGDLLQAAGAVAVGVAFVATGWVIATDFRGFTTWHTRATLRMMAPVQRGVSRLPPWRWMNLSPEVLLRRQLRLAKVIGAGFIAGGAICALAGVANVFVGD
jgi:hypothetical protein